jgi:uncharacterized protein YndB with AHSA1/START domain
MTAKNPTTITTPAGLPFIDIVREFDAPKDAVRKAYLDRHLIVQWLGPRGYEMEVDEWNGETGGRYLYTHRDPEGNAYKFSGVFHSVDDDMLVQTFEFDGWPGHVSLESVTFEDLGDGRTRIRNHSAYQSVEDRDGMAQSGMEKGINEGYERLDELLESSDVRQ